MCLKVSTKVVADHHMGLSDRGLRSRAKRLLVDLSSMDVSAAAGDEGYGKPR